MVNRSGKRKYATPKKKPPKTTPKEMTATEKGMIIAFFYCLRNIFLVAKIVGCPWSTVKSFLARACERFSLENLPRSGRPPALREQQHAIIIQAAKSNRKLNRSDFRDRYAPGVSFATGKATGRSDSS